MPRINLNQEICETLKSMRQSSRKTIEQVAAHLKKSTGYVSNIENCKAATIDLRDIYELTDFLLKDESEAKGIAKNKTKDVITSLLNDSAIQYTSEELKERNALIAFDKQFRDISIEDNFINFVRSELEKADLTPSQVIAEMNSNRFIEKKDNSIPRNKLIFSSSDSLDDFILFELPEDHLDKILSKEIKSSNYITLQGILYAINLHKGLPPEESAIEAHESLKELKIQTLPERREIMEEENILGIVSDINAKFEDVTALSKSTMNYFKAVKSLNDIFYLLKDQNTEYITSRLTTLNDSLSCPETISLTLAFLGLSLSDLKYINQKTQREFFNEVKSLLQKYVDQKSDKAEQIIEFE